MKNIFIIRHGETDINKKNMIQGRSINASINDLGRKQALAIVKALEEYPIQKVVTSSLVRTHETAKPLLEKCGFDCQRYEDLDEIDFGEIEGKEFDLIRDKMDEIHAEWERGNVEMAVKGGESPVQAYERANKKIQQILEHSDEENIAFVIHGRLIRILLSMWLGLGLRNMHKIEHQNGAVNHLRWKNGKFEAVELNKTDHLADLI